MRTTPTIHSFTAGQALVEGVAWYTVSTVALSSETRHATAVFSLTSANSGQASNQSSTWGNGAAVVIQAEL